MATLSSEDLSCILDAFERNRYFYGKLMTVRDFEQEQRYHNAKRWLVNRLLFGSGTVCGLEVSRVGTDPTTAIRIKRGVALDPCGREVIVPEDRTLDLKDLKIPAPVSGTDKTGYLCLAYDECTREPVPALKASTCDEVCDYSRIRETYRVEWHEMPAATPAQGLSDCETWLNRRTLTAQNAQVRAERTTPVWVVANEVFEVAVKVTALQNLVGVSLTETITAGTAIEPAPTPPSQFPTPPADLNAGEFFVYVYQVRASSGPGPVTIALGLTGTTPPALSSSIELVSDAEARRRQEVARRWLAGCNGTTGDACVNVAQIRVEFSGGSVSRIMDLDNLTPRRLIYNLGTLADLLECVRTHLLAAPGSPRPGHAFITFKDLDGTNPRPVGPTPAPGTADTVSHGDHVHALPLAPNSGLEFTAPDQRLRINGPVGGEAIDFQHPVRGQHPTDPRHLTTKQYVDAAVAGLDWQQSVLDKDLTTPPATPPAGARYLLFAAAVTGAWSGQAGSIATWTGTTWTFTAPNEGMAVFVEDENRAYMYVDGSWIEFLATPQVTAGAGLTATGAVLAVGRGAGIIVNPDDVAVAFEAAPPRPVGPVSQPGSANTVSRGDHVHALPPDVVSTPIATGVVIFAEFPEIPGQIALSDPIDPKLGEGPIGVILGVEQGRNEPIFIGSLEVFVDFKAPQVLLGAMVDPRAGQFRVGIRFPVEQRGTVRVRWWAFKPSQDLGEIVVSPTPTPRPTIEPTIRPTVEPTIPPTIRPTIEPTIEPTIRPTIELPLERTVREVAFNPLDFPGRRVDEVSGIGRAHTARLEEVGITNLAELASMELRRLAEVLDVSEVRARRFVDEARRLLTEA